MAHPVSMYPFSVTADRSFTQNKLSASDFSQAAPCALLLHHSSLRLSVCLFAHAEMFSSARVRDTARSWVKFSRNATDKMCSLNAT